MLVIRDNFCCTTCTAELTWILLLTSCDSSSCVWFANAFKPTGDPGVRAPPFCQECAVLSKPKSCPRCGEPNKTPAAKLRQNVSFGALLRALYPEEFVDRPAADTMLYEIRRKRAIDRLDAAMERCAQAGPDKATLPDGYRDQALRVINIQFSETEKHIGTTVLNYCEAISSSCPNSPRRRDAISGAARPDAFSKKKRKRTRNAGGASTTAARSPSSPKSRRSCSDLARVFRTIIR